VEMLLDKSPRNEGLLLAAASGFAQYAYAFVEVEADLLEDEDLKAAFAMRERAARLYLRGRDFGLRGLDARYAGITADLYLGAEAALQQTSAADVPLLYWTAVAWAGAIGASLDDPALIGQLPLAEALVSRALALDEDFDSGALHAVLIALEMSRPRGVGDPVSRARRHYDRAVELSGGAHAGPYVTWAESVSVKTQNVEEFRTQLALALAVNPDGRREWRLVNRVMQSKARWLLSRIDELFLLPVSE